MAAEKKNTVNTITVEQYRSGAGRAREVKATLDALGLGGIGKSDIALKFIYDHIDAFPYIFWLPADTIQKLNMAAANACKKLNLHLAEVSVDTSNSASLFRSWLLENGTS